MSPLLVESIGSIAATLTTIAFLPQAWRTIRTRQTRDISLWTQILLFAGNNMWLLYGVFLGSWPLIVANIITFFIVGTVLILKIRYG
jgi:MtN3 and saliva related transmembrane protein